MIHRDIKPANLLVDKQGRLKILDMGLARLDADGAPPDELTNSGQVMGTVDYMAPEQALNTKSADARSDVYSLGVTLWYLLQGRAMYAGNSAMEKLMAHQTQSIPSLTEVRGDIPEEIDRIFRRMVAKRPEERYASMALLLTELEDWRANSKNLGSTQSLDAGHQPTEIYHRSASGLTLAPSVPSAGPKVETNVVAEPTVSLLASDVGTRPHQPQVAAAFATPSPTQPQSSGRRSTPRKLWIALGGAASVFLLCLGVWVIVRDRNGKEVARISLPDRGSVVVEEQGTDPPPPSQEDPTGPPAVEPEPNAPLMPSPLDQLDPAEIPETERFVGQPRELVAVIGEHRRRHVGRIQQVAYSNDGRWIASISNPGGVRLLYAKTLEERLVFGENRVNGRSVVFTPDSQRLFATVSNAILVWDVSEATPRELTRIPVDKALYLALSGDGKKLAVADWQDSMLSQWDLSGDHPKEIGTRFRVTGKILLSKDGQQLASADDSGIKLWDPSVVPPQEQILGKHDAGATGQGFVFSPDGKMLLSAANDDIRFWDLKNDPVVLQNSLRHSIGNFSDDILSFSSDGKRLAVGGDDSRVYQWDNGNLNEVALLQRSNLSAVALSPDGRVLVGGDNDGAVRVWDLTTTPPREREPLATYYYRQLAFSPDGRKLLVANAPEGFELWSVDGPRPKRLPGRSTHQEGTVAGQGFGFTPDSQQFLVWGSKGAASFSVGKTSFHQQSVLDPQIDCFNGDTAVTLGQDKLRRWRYAQGALTLLGDLSSKNLWSDQQVISDTGMSTQPRAYSSDFGKVAHLRPGGIVAMTDLQTGETMVLADSGSNCLAYSPDNKYLAAGNRHGGVLIWEESEGGIRAPINLQGGAAQMSWLDFSADSRRLAGLDRLGSVHLWNLDTHEYLSVWETRGRCRPHHNHSVCFAPDSRHVAFVNRNGTVYILRLDPRFEAPASTPTTTHPSALVQRPSKFEHAVTWSMERSNDDRLGHLHPTVASYMVAVTTDGTRAAMATRHGQVNVWNTATGKLVQMLYRPALGPCFLAMSPDGHLLAAADCLHVDQKRVRIWDVATGMVQRELPVLSPNGLHWASDGKYLATGTVWSTIGPLVWNTSTWQRVGLTEDLPDCRAIAVSFDSTKIAGLTSQGQLQVWELSSGKLIVKTQIDRGDVGLAWSPDGGTLAIGGNGKKGPLLLNAITLEEIAQLEPHGENPYFRVFGWPAQDKLLCGSYHDVKIWNLRTGQPEKGWAWHNAALSADGKHLVTSDPPTVSLVNPQTGEPIRTLAAGEGRISDLPASTAAWSHHGKRAAFSDGRNGRLVIWDLEHRERVIDLPELGFEGPAKLQPVAWALDDQRLAIATKVNQVQVLESESFTVKRTLPLAATAVAWLPEGKLVLGVGKSLEVWDASLSNSETFEHTSDIVRLQLSPDATHLLVVGSDGESALRSVANLGHSIPLLRTLVPACPPAWSDDGRWLAAATRYEEHQDGLAIWDMEAGGQCVSEQNFSSRLRAIQWSSNGEALHCWSPDAGLWRADREYGGRYPVGSLPMCDSAQFLRGSKVLATSQDHTLWFWDSATGEPAGVFAMFPQDRWMAVSPTGDYHGTVKTSDLVFLVRTADGHQHVLTPDEFSTQYGWQNKGQQPPP